MWGKIKKLFCSCYKAEILIQCGILEINKCTKCGQYWLYNKEVNERVKITKAYAEKLYAEFDKVNKL